MNDKPIGRITHLPNNRMVFVGQCANERDVFYFAFQSSDGDQRWLKLSREAADALVQLYADFKPGIGEIFPSKMVWVGKRAGPVGPA